MVPEREKRERSIDCFKGILTILMIFAHCIQFFGTEEDFPQNVILNYINLTTFSGFLFCFGYVSNKAYFEKEFKACFPKILKNALKLLFAFYVSGIAFIALVENKIFRWDFIKEILLLRYIPGWSEFLIAFAVLMVVELVLFRMFQRLKGKLLFAIAGISFLSTFIPYERITNPLAALLIGTVHYNTFPIVPYLFYFAFGVMVCKWADNPLVETRKNQKLSFVLCTIASLAAMFFAYLHNGQPMRFPPTWMYVFGGLLFVYSYYLVTKWITDKKKNKVAGIAFEYLCSVGSKSLFYLLVSNLIIFAFAGSAFAYRDIGYAVVFYILLLLLLRYLEKLVKK